MGAFHDFIRDQATAIMAAAFGAFLSLPFMRSVSPLTAITAVFSGVGCAYYFTPFIAKWLSLSMQSYGAVAFVLGFSGMMFLTGVMRMLESWAANPLGLVQKLASAWRGKSGDK